MKELAQVAEPGFEPRGSVPRAHAPNHCATCKLSVLVSAPTPQKIAAFTELDVHHLNLTRDFAAV